MSLTEQLVGQKLKQFAWDLDELDRQIHKLEPQVRKRVEQINAGSVEPFDVSNLTTITAAIQDALQVRVFCPLRLSDSYPDINILFL